MNNIDIVIPSFNGRYLLEKHLPKVIEYTPHLNKLIIVDDGGSDDTKSFLNKNYPKSLYLYHSKNLGFSKSVNQGVSHSRSEFLVLLNNDVSPQKNYLENSLKHFENPKVFAVTFNEKNSSWPDIKWDNGKIGFTRGIDKSKSRFSGWASGGSAIFRRSIWDKLDGFKEIYSPGYWEDIDLGWRAWKAGYRIIWEPKSLVVHEHESTFNKLNPKYVALIKQRNELFSSPPRLSQGDICRSQVFTSI
jgi:GT2 family glycosyltransferase